MLDRLAAEIERIRSDESIQSLDEANVKLGVILPVLNALGWNPFNINEVRPEYPVQGGNVDYSLRLNGANRVFLEAKRPSEDLNKHQVQLLNYSFADGVPLAVLTNGLNWWFYLPLQVGSWEERRFTVIDLQNPDVSQTTDSLIDFLSRENVRSGYAVGYAESLLDRFWKDKEIEKALPKAWKQLITDPDDQILALLNQKVMELCGWGADLDQIKRFLANLSETTSAPPTAPPLPVGPRPRKPRIAKQNGSDYLKKHPAGFTFNGQTYRVTKWWVLLTTLAEQIYLLRHTDFHRVVELGGTKRRYFSDNPQGMDVPKPVGNSGYYAETKFDANNIVRRCHDLLDKFGYSHDDLQIETT